MAKRRALRTTSELDTDSPESNQFHVRKGRVCGSVLVLGAAVAVRCSCCGARARCKCVGVLCAMFVCVCVAQVSSCVRVWRRCCGVFRISI